MPRSSRNLYGYTVYNGPNNSTIQDKDNDDETNPLRVGMWMEGDSLSPPCGTSVSTIHTLLEFASVSPQDVLLDLGCGDGRICLEALTRCNSANVVGVDIEDDLIERFRDLIEKLPMNLRERVWPIQADLRHSLATLIKRAKEKNHGEQEQLETHPPLPTVIVLYLLPDAIEEIQGDVMELLQLLPDLRVVCSTWGLLGVEPANTLELSENGGATTVLHLYTSQAKKDTK